MMMDFGYLEETFEAVNAPPKSPLLLLSCFHFSQDPRMVSNASALGRNGVHDFIPFVLPLSS